MREVDSVFEPLPPQWAFFESKAKVLGYGGAMGGGKSRCLCEWVFDHALRFPGLVAVMARQSHVSIVDSTRKIMFQQVIPPEILSASRVIESGGKDFIQLMNGSTIHFIGLDDPGKQFSTEIGLAAFDEAHQIEEDDVLLIRTRLRQRCPECLRANRRDCGHYPRRIALGFNPENPGHWLYQWFISGANMDLWDDGKLKGYHKAELYAAGGDRPLGDCEFIFSKATDNSYLPASYIEQELGGLKPLLRKRYLEGQWIYVSGQSFFDVDALSDYETRVRPPWKIAKTEGDPLRDKHGMISKTDKPRLREHRDGNWWIWKAPVRAREIEGEKFPAHRYVAAVDVSSGTANDFSAIQVIDVDTFSQVAEYQALIDPDLLALEAARIGLVYNDALIAPEITGGWGASVVRKLEQLKYRKIYTRRVEDRLAKKFTDVLGWDTTNASRSYMTDKLEEVLREREFELLSMRCLSELASFVYPKKKDKGEFELSPRAQSGANDDLVITLAMAVAVCLKLPKEFRRPVEVRPMGELAAVPGY
jgi:hypothetical protein